MMYKLTLLYWILFLFKPDWMMGYYFPPLEVLSRGNIFALGGIFLSALFSSEEKEEREYTYLLPLVVVCLFSVAFAGNTGAGRPFLKLIFQYYMLGIITLTYINTWKRLRVLFVVILLHFLFLGVWGIGYRVVPWHARLNETNAFGPYMALAVTFSLFYLHGEKNKYLRVLCYVMIPIAFANIVRGFTMGSFVSLVALGFYLLIRYPRKVRGVLIVGALALTFVVVLDFLAKRPERYWKEMEKLTGNVEESSVGGERLFLWGIALREFADNPVFGVGLNNFGIEAVKFASDAEVEKAGLVWNSAANLWGFSLHNSHLQVPCELGVIGMIIYILLFVDFIRKNSFIRWSVSRLQGSQVTLIDLKDMKVERQDWALSYALSMSVEGGVFAYLISGMFYGILFYPDLWINLIANRALYKQVKRWESIEKC
jgi:hypothetical protein